MIFKFKDIPEDTGFSIFDCGNKGSGDSKSVHVGPGDVEFDFQIPAEWEEPHFSLAPFLYFVPDSYGPLDRSRDEFTRSGDDYYLDVTRDATREEINKQSVENILTQISKSDPLTGRQRFYVSLMALNSHFEFLTHTILVTSGYMSRRKFRDLTHEKRIDDALDSSNANFFADTITICPGKQIEPGDIRPEVLVSCKDIMHKVRKLRNDVAHGWGYADLSNNDIIDFFKNLGVTLPYSDTDEKLFENAANHFVALWAKVQTLNTRAAIVQEKQIIKAERAERGYR